MYRGMKNAEKRGLQSSHGYGLYAGEIIKDNLDLQSVAYIRELIEQGTKNPHAVDLGGGKGVQSIRMAENGARVTMIDRFSAADIFRQAELEDQITEHQIRMIVKDWRDLSDDDEIGSIDLLYSQRALSYISYPDLLSVFSFLMPLTTAEFRLYASFNGIDSFYGVDNPNVDKKLEERHGMVNDLVREKLNAHEEMTLYSEKDVARFCDAIGMQIQHLKYTRFRNIQIIAHKK